MTKIVKYQTGFALLCLAVVLIGQHALTGTFVASLHMAEYTHILLILPISAALIWLEWKSVRVTAAVNIFGGALIIGIAAAIACYVLNSSQMFADDEVRAFEMAAIVLSWIGSFVLVFGYRSSRSVMFPLCFMFGLVPLPQVVLDVIVVSLQYSSSWAAHMLFTICGVPVVRNGIFLALPGLTLEVAPECSSIRSSSMLLIMTMVLAHLLLRSPLKKAFMMLFAIPLSVAKNGLRIFSLGMLGTKVDPGYLTGRFHHQGGIIFLLIALAIIAIMLWVFRRFESTQESMTDATKSADDSSTRLSINDM